MGGWDGGELRRIQDFMVSPAINSAQGVSEVGSIGGMVQEYQVELDVDAMRAFDVRLEEVAAAVRSANAEVGARTTEINGAEYLIRGLGFIKSIDDLEQAVIRTVEGTPVVVGDVARIQLGPDLRRGALTKSGVEAVGGVVTARYGANPREVIDNVNEAIDEVQLALPSKELDDGTVSQVTIVPFYDRTELIERTLGTLNTALSQQILITILVVLLLMLHLRTSLLVSGLLPVAVLMTFVAMKYTGVDANVLALAGIAIAIGTMVDMGIVMTENIAQQFEGDDDGTSRTEKVARGATEVAPAVVTAIATTVISFLPVFMLTGQEGRLFTPLAFTKTYALIASLFVAVVIIPVIASAIMGRVAPSRWTRRGIGLGLILGSLFAAIVAHGLVGMALTTAAVCWLVGEELRETSMADWRHQEFVFWGLKVLGLGSVILTMAWLLTQSWMPLGAGLSRGRNFLFVAILVGGLLGLFWLFRLAYPHLLRALLRHKALFLPLPALVVVAGVTIWMGFGTVFSWLPDRVHQSSVGQWMHHEVGGLDREFMPHLDEGAFLYMPTAMPHASFGEVLEMTQQADLLIETIPEVEVSVGKFGRADTPLDPAPIGMLETVIHYKPEFKIDDQGRRLRFAVDGEGEFLRDGQGELIPDEAGRPYRNWRDEIRYPRDIWDEIIEVTKVIPGLPSTSMLQPISTRIVMLQSGIRAPMAVRLQGQNLDDLADAALQVERHLLQHPAVNHGAVNVDRPVGKPYLNIVPHRDQLARYGVTMESFQSTISAAIGGMTVTETVEGRERFAVKVRYPRELRDSPEAFEEILVTSGEGAPIPLRELASVEYQRGPEMIRSENSALITYVMFNSASGVGPIDAVESVQQSLVEAIDRGDLTLPDGVRFGFVGEYEQNQRAEQRLRLLVPLMLLIIFSLIYLQFRSVATSLAIFSAVAVAFGGGFIMLWLFAQPWFLDVHLLGASMREVFQINAYNLSIAVWVGFIALFGIAADDGIVMATYLKQRFEQAPPETIEEVRERVVEAGLRRVRPCLMTTATTILALLPILTSYGTGADVMIPMAVPLVGGMTLALLTLFVLPVLYSVFREAQLHLQRVKGNH